MWKNYVSGINFYIARDPVVIVRHVRPGRTTIILMNDMKTFIWNFWDERNTHLRSGAVCSKDHLHECVFKDIARY